MWPSPKQKSKYTFVYILRDLNYPHRFKIGMSDEPDRRARQEDWRLYGKKAGLSAFIEAIADWHFGTPQAAYYVEQSIIDTLRRMGFQELDKKFNWFEIDPGSLDFVLEGLQPLITATQKHACDVFFSSEARRRDKPYGKYFWKWLKSLNSV
jgi:hypothetical protein